jgi:hypothetical protein
MGRDYRARVVPIPDVAQAPWSLIVYRDLSIVRTDNLQATAMASTLFLWFLSGRAAIGHLVRGPPASFGTRVAVAPRAAHGNLPGSDPSVYSA